MGGDNVFQQASSAYSGGLQMLQNAQDTGTGNTHRAGQMLRQGPDSRINYGGQLIGQAGPSPLLGEAADMVQGMGPGYAGVAQEGLAQQPGATGAAQQGFAQSTGAGAVPRTMNQYLNPYQDQVLDQLQSRAADSRNEALNNVRAQAAQAGAYGGARQGLVEARAMEDSFRAENEAMSQALQSGFNTAAQFGQGQQGLEQQAAQGMLSVGQQDISRQQALGQLGLASQGQQLSQAQTLANIGQTGSQQQLAQGQAMSNLGLQSDAQRQQAAQLLGNLGLGLRDSSIGLAQAAFSAAPLGMRLGQQALQAQSQAGGQVQGLNQSILDQGAGQYDSYANAPMTSLATAIGAMSGNPLNAATTSTGTQSYNPGLFDYLGLGAGVASAGLRGSAFGGGK